MHLDIICTSLEDRYNLILNTRMSGMPLVNSQLRVEVVGLQTWNDVCVGVLITPWFMNLMLISCEGARWNDLKVGSIQVHDFPSGRYEFVVGHEEGIGYFQSCSLFSPMFDFNHHDDALLVAQEAMNVIMDEKHRNTACQTGGQEIQDIWEGKSIASDAGEAAVINRSTAAPGQKVSLDERLLQPMSRRAMIRGGFLRGDGT